MLVKYNLSRHSEREKKTRQTEEEVERQHQGMDRPGIRYVPDGSGEQRKMGGIGCEIICGAPTTRAVKGWVKVNAAVDSTFYFHFHFFYLALMPP